MDVWQVPQMRRIAEREVCVVSYVSKKVLNLTAVLLPSETLLHAGLSLWTYEIYFCPAAAVNVLIQNLRDIKREIGSSFCHKWNGLTIPRCYYIWHILHIRRHRRLIRENC